MKKEKKYCGKGASSQPFHLRQVMGNMRIPRLQEKWTQLHPMAARSVHFLGRTSLQTTLASNTLAFRHRASSLVTPERNGGTVVLILRQVGNHHTKVSITVLWFTKWSMVVFVLYFLLFTGFVYVKCWEYKCPCKQ